MTTVTATKSTSISRVPADNFFCNVDASQPYWVQIRDHYVRQGRIDLDGYQLYKSSLGQTTVLDNMFKASEVFDQRRPTPVVAHGQS